MQPHHDTRGNDLKIYVWMSDYNEKSHPLYYLKGSHNNWKFYITENHHRRIDILKEKMDKVYGDKGDLILFDTHGWHSHIKKNTVERTVLELTIIPNNYFFCSESTGQSSFNQI
jgi:signal recognition particle GTPase